MKHRILNFITRPIPLSLGIVFICAIGLLCYLKLPVSDLPEVNYPVITVSAFYSGATPQIVADTIAYPLEQQLSTVQGVHSMFSVSREGYTNITLTFEPNYNLDSAIPDIQRAISYAIGYMPILQSPPTFSKNNPSLLPIMYIVADSNTVPHDDLFQLINKNVATPINLISGVSQVSIWSVSSAIRILLDPLKMAQYGISFDDISNLLANSSRLSSGGFLTNSERTFSINPEGQIKSPEGYKKLILKYAKSGDVKIGDIGNVIYTPEQTNYQLDYFDSQNSGIIENPILVQVSRQNNSNVMLISSKIHNFLFEIKNSFPKSINMKVVYDRSVTIAASIIEAKITLVFAMLLVVLVIYIFLGRFLLAYIPSIIILSSLCGTFIVMYLLDYSLNNISILALIIAVGFIVDDSIVVIENISTLLSRREKIGDIIVANYVEISKPVLSMSLSLVIVLLSLFFIGGITGAFFREFAVVSISMVVFSLIFSLTISPSLSIIAIKKIGEKKDDNIKANKVFIDKVVSTYSLALDKFLKAPIFGILILVVCILGSALFFSIVPKDFIPSGDSGTISGSFQIPVGLSTPIMKKYQKDINSILSKNSSIKNFLTITGIYTGADQSNGLININLKNISERKPINYIVEELRNKFKAMPYALGNVYLYPQSVMELGTGGQSTASGDMYSYVISGLNNEQVLKYGKTIEKELKNDKRFVDVQSDIKQNLPQLNIKILRDRASSLGISVSNIENTLMYAYSEGTVIQYLNNSNFYDVIIQLQNKYRNNPSSLSNLFLRSSISGEMIPLSSLIKIKEVTGPQIVSHYQGLPSCTISFNLNNDVSLGKAVTIINSISGSVLPVTLHGKFQGTAEEFINSFSRLALLIFITIFALYILLGMIYNSYLYPIIILSTVPVSLFGAFGALLLFNIQLSLFGYIGSFLLIGIIVKNGIMMVDLYIRKLENISYLEAIKLSCTERFRPMFMTGLTSIFGAIPLIYSFGIDTSSRRPIGLIIIGGLILSQILTLFIVPSLLFYKNRVSIYLQRVKK